MPSSATLGVFIAATVTLILIPGPSTFYILGRGLTAGRRAAFAAGLGIETGSALFVCLTAFGLSALIASTSYALMTLHYLGAAYLLVLAVRALGAGGAPPAATGGAARYGSAYRQGFLVGASNPKVALFFLAFFPQFVDPDRGAAATQVLVLGTIFVALGLVADTLYAFLSGSIGRVLTSRPAFLRIRMRVEAASYFGLAGWSLASGSGTTRS
jgi:threonine/homoserine/homoserine lactone efflux protein